jgi:hypothetical protein
MNDLIIDDKERERSIYFNNSLDRDNELNIDFDFIANYGSASISFWINKSQAIEIVNHLNNLFEIS